MMATMKNPRSKRAQPTTDERPARLAVDLPREVHRQLKMRAAAEGRTVRDVILDLLRKDGIRRR